MVLHPIAVSRLSPFILSVAVQKLQPIEAPAWRPVLVSSTLLQLEFSCQSPNHADLGAILRNSAAWRCKLLPMKSTAAVCSSAKCYQLSNSSAFQAYIATSYNGQSLQSGARVPWSLKGKEIVIVKK